MIACSRLACFAPSYLGPFSSHCLAASPAATTSRLRSAPPFRSLRPNNKARMSSGAPQGGKAPPLFIYGSLLATEVMAALINRVPTWEVEGHRRYGLSHRPYPGLVREEGGAVKGLIVCGLSEEESAVLDYFEGDEYVRAMVTVNVCREAHSVEHPGYLPQVLDQVQQESVEAFAYLWKKSLSDKLQGSWEPQDFLKMDLVPSYAANAKGYGIQGSKEWKEGTYAIRPLQDPSEH